MMKELFIDIEKGDKPMKKVIAKAPLNKMLILLMALMFAASTAFGYEVMNEAFSQSNKGANVAGGEFIKLSDGQEGWRATTSTEAYNGEEPNYMVYDIKNIKGLQEGTIEFFVQRSREGGVVYERSGNPETYDTLFELLAPSHNTVFSLMIMWDYANNANESALLFNHSQLTSGSGIHRVWPEVVPMGFKPEIGDSVHVAITFGATPSDNKVYINGAEIGRSENLLPGVTVGTADGSFADYITASASMRIGIETGAPDNYPGGSSMLYRSVLSSIVVDDEIKTSFALDGFAYAGIPAGLKADYADSSVSLTWGGAQSSDVVGYNVYKKAVNESTYTKLNDTEVSDSGFSDGDVT